MVLVSPESFSLKSKKVFRISGFVVFEVVKVFEEIDEKRNLIRVVPEIYELGRGIEDSINEISETFLDVCLEEFNFHVLIEVDFTLGYDTLHVWSKKIKNMELGAWEIGEIKSVLCWLINIIAFLCENI